MICEFLNFRPKGLVGAVAASNPYQTEHARRKVVELFPARRVRQVESGLQGNKAAIGVEIRVGGKMTRRRFAAPPVPGERGEGKTRCETSETQKPHGRRSKSAQPSRAAPRARSIAAAARSRYSRKLASLSDLVMRTFTPRSLNSSCTRLHTRR